METICLSLLDVLVQTILVIINSNGLVDCLVACLIGLLQLLDEFHYAKLWDELSASGEQRKALKDFLIRIFLALHELVRNEVFPPDWLVITMQANQIILKATVELAQPLVFRFLQGNFDAQLWSYYFNLAVAFLTQPSLQLEHYSEVKREKIIQKYGDMRVLVGFQVSDVQWFIFGEVENFLNVGNVCLHFSVFFFMEAVVDVVPPGRQEVGVHPKHGRAFSRSDVGTRERAQKGRSSHFLRHDGVRTQKLRQFQVRRIGAHQFLGHPCQ